MRILHLIHRLSGGGAEQQLGYLAPALAGRGHDVHIAFSQSGPADPAFSGIELHRLKSRSNHDPSLLIQLVGLIRKLNPDVIHTWILQMDILGGLASKLTGVPYVLREPASSLAYTNSWKFWLRVRAGARAKTIVSNSAEGNQYWQTKAPRSKRVIIRNALHVDEIAKSAPNLPEAARNSNLPVILSVGRLEKFHKKADIFLRALALVRKKIDVFGVLCGEGAHYQELVELRHLLGLDDRLVFTGHLPSPQVWAIMKQASAMVSCSNFEGCPNAVMEAMVCGCPLVLSDIPSHRDIVDENSAIFFKTESVEGAANAILDLLSNIKRSRERAIAARERSLQWSVREMSINYEEVYREICT